MAHVIEVYVVTCMSRQKQFLKFHNLAVTYETV